MFFFIILDAVQSSGFCIRYSFGSHALQRNIEFHINQFHLYKDSLKAVICSLLLLKSRESR